MSYSYASIRNALLELSNQAGLSPAEDEVEEAIDALADEDLSEGIEIELDGETWVITDDLHGMAAERLKEDLENEPEIFPQSWLKGYYHMPQSTQEEFASDLADSAYDLDDDDALERAAMDEDDDPDEAREALREESYNHYLAEFREDAVGYLQGEFGYSFKDLLDKFHLQLDIPAAVEAALNADGPAPFLASYDGNSYEMSNGLEAFRID